MMTGTNRARVAILGASGYMGAEAVRLLSRHPQVEIRAVTADRKAGATIAEVFPHLGGLDLPALAAIDALDWSDYDVVFCALPHGTTQDVVAAIPATTAVVDVSADFRLTPDAYAQWYGQPHRAPARQNDAVNGLTEFPRDAVRSTRLAACPGCYPTCALLPLTPLVEAGAVDPDRIVIDAKSGVSGAGRALKEGSLYAEVAEAVHAYGVGHHRHMAELDMVLSTAAGRPVTPTFTPHLMPMNRGMLTTSYVETIDGRDARALHAMLAERFAGEPFVRVVPFDQTPATRHVRGSNLCLIGVAADRQPGRAIVVSVLDNLVKGGSGQGVQNMNLMLGFAETAGLDQQPLFP
jgi:N-acetyl-gamma-glutamyl-phosphate reductase